MNVFELKPCREIGIIKEFIKEAILDGDIPNNKKAAYDLMLKKGTQLGLKSTI
jgi:tRNA nucleotidyltransferase (CCA-adding enzyme)